MKLEFRLMKLKENSKFLEIMREQTEKLRANNNLRHEIKNEFIIVGERNIENEEYYKVNQLNENGLSTFGDLDLAFVSLTIPKKEFIWDGETFTVLDIPKKNLTVDLIDDIKRLNY